MDCLVWECVEKVWRFISQKEIIIAIIIAIAISVVSRRIYCRIRRRIRWWSRYSIPFKTIIFGIEFLLAMFILALILTALGCSPIHCLDLGNITINFGFNLNNNCNIKECLDASNTLSFNVSNNNPNIVGWLTVILTAIIGYLGYKINNSQKRQVETQIMEEMYHGIIEEAKERLDEFEKWKSRYPDIATQALSKYITALNRLGYYVYKGTLDPRIVEEQFAVWILKNHVLLLQYPTELIESVMCIPKSKNQLGMLYKMINVFPKKKEGDTLNAFTGCLLQFH